MLLLLKTMILLLAALFRN